MTPEQLEQAARVTGRKLELEHALAVEHLQAEVERLQREIAHLQIEVTNLRGLKPEIPPLPGEDWPKELPRYGLRENGPRQPRSVPMKDGYWTPWYLANQLYEELERERKAAKTACANWGEMKQERDRLKIELERYSMSAGAADQFRREALAVRQALGFDKYGDDIAPVDLLNALDRRDAEVIERFLHVEAPRIDAGGPNPIDPQLHHCEWTLHQERERLHAAVVRDKFGATR